MVSSKRAKIILAALVISLILNINLLWKVERLEDRMNELSSAQHSVISNINGQTEQMRSVLDEFVDEQSWISRIGLDANADSVDEQQATFTWQVKELRAGSKVNFHYAYGHSEEFTTLQAEEIQKGLFQVSIPLEVEMEPQWNVSLHTVGRHAHTIVEESAEETGQPIRFFVSVTTDDIVRSGNMQTERLDHLGGRQYGDIITDIQLDEQFIYVNLTHHHHYSSAQKIERADLLTYDGDALLSEEEIKLESPAPGYHPHSSGTIQQERNDSMRHVIKVRYSDGKTFEKEF